MKSYVNEIVSDEEVCLSPCGESGLKFLVSSAGSPPGGSLPMRGEWIEISVAT